jgi:hypothetical protein
MGDQQPSRHADVSEVEKQMPGTLAAVQEWYRVYKVAEGKQKNSYAFDDKALDRVQRCVRGAWCVVRVRVRSGFEFRLNRIPCNVKAFTLSVLQHGHESWRKLFTARSSPKFAFDSASGAQ